MPSKRKSSTIHNCLLEAITNDLNLNHAFIIYHIICTDHFHHYPALIIDQEGQFNITQGASLEVNLSNQNWRFRNDGTIINNGDVTIIRPLGQTIMNTGSIINNTGSNFLIIDP